VNATLSVTADRMARFRITNDGVGHSFPSGGNWLSVRHKATDASGRVLRHRLEGFGRNETHLIDFWPLNLDKRIAPGDQREIRLPLPPGRGRVEAVVRYRDGMRTKRIVRTLKVGYDEPVDVRSRSRSLSGEAYFAGTERSSSAAPFLAM
jgi:hypothetical protein